MSGACTKQNLLPTDCRMFSPHRPSSVAHRTVLYEGLRDWMSCNRVFINFVHTFCVDWYSTCMPKINITVTSLSELCLHWMLCNGTCINWKLWFTWYVCLVSCIIILWMKVWLSVQFWHTSLCSVLVGIGTGCSY